MVAEQFYPGGPPTDGRVVVRREGDERTIEFLARGVDGSVIVPFLVACLFGGFGLLAIVNTLAAAIAGPVPANNRGGFHSVWDVLWALLGLSAFAGVGIGLALLTIDGILRRTTITLTRDTLSIVYRGVFGTGRREWPLYEVAEVYVAPCGGPKGRINRKLVVQTFDGRKRGFLRGREHTEVEWAASVLRAELGLEDVKL